ncbi:MAG: hypothetical protein K2H87_05005 [Duncaniella sp.]|nr:hypothetical protein [Duncaniella sp.]
MIARSGNFGFVRDSTGRLMSFSMGTRSRSWATGGALVGNGFGASDQYRIVHGVRTIPYGVDDDMPGYVDRILSRFYAGEGIMGKKIGLLWGDGPALYTEQISEEGRMIRRWVVDPEVSAALDSTDFRGVMQRCLADLVHLEGFWVKVFRSRAPRLGLPGRIAGIEHVPARRVRFVYRGRGLAPIEAVEGEFPAPYTDDFRRYPLFDPRDPLRHPVSLAYFPICSYNKEPYSFPRFEGAFGWLELAGTLPEMLAAYNENASAVSMHIESPQSYWDAHEQRIRQICERAKIPYEARMLEEFKDAAMEKFAESMTGKKNAGKFLHTSQFWNEDANNFQGWKITPIDKKIKDFIEAQVAICRKSEAAATSGFGLDPALSNLILDTKLGSGSEKLYSLKVFNATETAVPEMVLCSPFNTFIRCNFPESTLRLGLRRPVVDAEQDVSPQDRMKANV